MILFMCGNTYVNTNELIYTTETDSQTQETNMINKGERGWGGVNQELGLADTNCYTENKQQRPTVQHQELYLTSWNKPLQK